MIRGENLDQSRKKSLYFLLLSTLRRNNLEQAKPEKTKQLVKNLDILELENDWVIFSEVDNIQQAVTISKTEFKFYPNKKLSSYSEDPTILNKMTAGNIIKTFYELFGIAKEPLAPKTHKNSSNFSIVVTMSLFSTVLLSFRDELPHNLTLTLQLTYSFFLAKFISTLAIKLKHQRLLLALLFPIIAIWMNVQHGTNFMMSSLYSILFVVYGFGIFGRNKLVATNVETVLALVILLAGLFLNLSSIYHMTIFDNLFLIMYISWIFFSKASSGEKKTRFYFHFFVFFTGLFLTLLISKNWTYLFSILLAIVLSYKSFQCSSRKSELELFFGVQVLFL